MAAEIFLDSDGVIGFFTDRELFANPASEIYDLSVLGYLQLFLSAVSINNIYHLIRKYLDYKRAILIIEELTEMIQIAGTTRIEIIQALKNDFKDSIQYATALSIEGIEAILTHNVKDYSKSEIAVFTPENYLKSKQ